MFDIIFNGTLKALRSFFTDVSPRFILMIAAGLTTFFAVFLGPIGSMVQVFLQAIPWQNVNFAPYVTFLEYVNPWFPLVETVVLLTALYTFKISFIAIKLFIKIFIPTLG